MPSKVSSLMLSFTVALGAIFLMFPPSKFCNQPQALVTVINGITTH